MTKKLRMVTTVILVLAMTFICCACGEKQDFKYGKGTDAGALPPKLTIYGSDYYAPYMPVDELPDGYEFIGELTEEQAKDTGLAGCKIYAIPERNSFDRFYLYQECGTPIGENTVDQEMRQWAYVEWIREGFETTN